MVIRMKETDHRFHSSSGRGTSTATPTLQVIIRFHEPAELQGFNRYPIDPDETRARWRRQKVSR